MSNVSAKTSAAPDYSKKECWYKIPEITKDVDTFYVYATEYIMGSFEEGAPDYATIDNEEMRLGVKYECRDHAMAFGDVTNVFLPYYRQSGLRYAGEVIKETGDFTTALMGGNAVNFLLEKLSECEWTINDVMKGSETSKAIVGFNYQEKMAGTIELTMIKEDKIWRIDSLAMPKFDKFNLPQGNTD